MKAVSLILRDLFKMFIDDKFLALGLLGVVAVAALLTWIGLPALFVGGLLVFGSLAALTLSVVGPPLVSLIMRSRPQTRRVTRQGAELKGSAKRSAVATVISLWS